MILGIRPSMFTCNVHPVRGWHEIGCNDREWTTEELKGAVKSCKKSVAMIENNPALTKEQRSELLSANRAKRQTLEDKIRHNSLI